MENAATSDFDLNAKCDDGYTAFHLACRRGQLDVVKLFMENAAALSIELNSENNDGLTAFHLACQFGQVKGHSDVIEIFMENATALNINLKTFIPEPHENMTK